MGQLVGRINESTTPDLKAGWFAEHHRAMAALAGVIVLPLLLISIIGALAAQDLGRLLRTVFGFLPLAGIFSATAVGFVVLGLAITDGMTSWVSQGASADATKAPGSSAELRALKPKTSYVVGSTHLNLTEGESVEKTTATRNRSSDDLRVDRIHDPWNSACRRRPLLHGLLIRVSKRPAISPCRRMPGSWRRRQRNRYGWTLLLQRRRGRGQRNWVLLRSSERVGPSKRRLPIY